MSSITINGNVGTLKTMSGDVKCKDIEGDVSKKLIK
jgi:hypothetical protein